MREERSGGSTMLDYVGNLREIESKLPSFMEDNPQTGRFRVARDIFTDPDLFELEMKHIWEGNWIYLAHETQIPNKNDYFTMYMGRQPIFIARNRNGELNAHQCLQPPRRDAVPAQEGQQVDLHLPLPRLDVQQLRQAPEGQGPGRR